MILLIGSEGSMGKRYQAIFNYLKKDVRCTDVRHSPAEVLSIAQDAEGIVLATPTGTHADYIRTLAGLRKPILCEKPVSKDLAELQDVFKDLRRLGTPFRMMMQYQMLADTASIGTTRYDYFRHGSDGLIWDCLQVIGLARGKIELYEESPIWSCKLNGKALNLSHMDAAYIGYIQKWFQYPYQSLEKLEEIHAKTAELEMKSLYGRHH